MMMMMMGVGDDERGILWFCVRIQLDSFPYKQQQNVKKNEVEKVRERERKVEANGDNGNTKKKTPRLFSGCIFFG